METFQIRESLGAKAQNWINKKAGSKRGILVISIIIIFFSLLFLHLRWSWFVGQFGS